MKNQTIFFIAVCVICFLFYRCNNLAKNTAVTNDSSASNTTMYAGYATQAEWADI